MTYVPRGRHFEEFAVGEAFTTAARTVTEGAVDRFAGLSGDFNPLHIDEESARQGPDEGPDRPRKVTKALALAGLTAPEGKALYGGLDGTPYGLDARRLVAVARAGT